jgi:Ca2+-binding EF-hand superfamily protein
MIQQWKQALQQADGDQDGSLSQDEFAQLTQSLQAAATGSTAAAGAASTADSASLFAKLDQNGDGKLSTDDLSAARPRHHHHHAKVGGSAMSVLMGLQGDGQAGFGSGIDSLVQTAAAKLIGGGDTNGDGGLTLQEFTGGPANSAASDTAGRAFSSADGDGDGVLTADELAGAMKTGLDQRLNQAGVRAYGQLLSMFNDIAGQVSTPARTPAAGGVSVTA